MCYNLHRAAAALLCVVALAGCAPSPQRGQPVKVVATIVPLADWARQIGGARVDVQLIVPPAVDPRSYTPTQAQRDAIQRADVVLLNGLDLEPWIDTILDGADNKQLVVLDMSQFTGPLVEVEKLSGAESFERAATNNAPRSTPTPEPQPRVALPSAYLWLDPRSAMRQVDLITQTLVRADPDGISDYRQNGARYSGELENLDSHIQRQIETWKWRALVANDTALQPLAKRYGLPIKQPVSGGSLSPARDQPLLVDALRDATRASTAAATPRRPIVAYNPLAGQTYMELMRNNALTFTMAMSAREQARTN